MAKTLGQATTNVADADLINSQVNNSDLKEQDPPTAQDFASAPTSNFDLSSAGQKLMEGASKMVGSFGTAVTDIGKNIGNSINSLVNGSGFKNLASGLSPNAAQTIAANAGVSPLNQKMSIDGTNGAPRENLDDVVIILESTISDDYVRFAASPRISESRQAHYQEVNITHHPGSILKYEKTATRSWSVSARLISRTPAEASVNQEDLNLIRSWVMPFYGEGTQQNNPSILGAPPPVLKLSGYGPHNISPIPVVLEGYDTSWPNDVDYIPTLEGEPFPVIMEINLNLKESYSPQEYSNFNLFAYKSGELGSAFTGQLYTENTDRVSSSSVSNEHADTSEAKILGKGFSGVNVPKATDLANPASSLSKQLSEKIGGTVSSMVKNMTNSAVNSAVSSVGKWLK